MNDYLPDKALLLQALEARVTPDAWTRLPESEREAIALIIRGRCAKVIEAAFAEFSELVMRTQSKVKP